MLDLSLVYMVSFTFVKYYFIVLFVAPKMSFVELQVCISSGDNRRAVYSHRVSSAKLVPCLLLSRDSTPVPHPISLLLKASPVGPGLYFPKLLSAIGPDLYFACYIILLELQISRCAQSNCLLLLSI